MEAFLGMAISWLIIEFLVFIVFLATMMLCLIKSMFNHSITADNSKMFGAQYLSFLCDKLVESLIEKVEADPKAFPRGIYSERQIVDRQLIVEPYWCRDVHIRLNKIQYYDMILKLNDEDFEGKFVEKKKVNRWMENAVPGNITKKQLD